MSESTKLPNPQQMLGIAKESLRAKDKATQLHTPIKDKKKSFYEVGNGNPKAMSLLESLLKIHGNNEIRALDTAAHCQQAIEVFLTEVREKGHVANLDDLAKQAAEGDDDDTEDTGLNAAPTAEGGVPLGDALAQFEGTKEVAARRRAARKGLDLPQDGSAAVTAEAAPPAPINDDAPPAPAPDDFEEDNIRPAFLRQREKEREEEKVGSVH